MIRESQGGDKSEIRTKNRTARKLLACGPLGGLFGIDQEVVTLSTPPRSSAAGTVASLLTPGPA